MKKLIVITRPHFFPGEGEIIDRLFREGLELLHLRKPGSEASLLYSLLDEIPRTYYPRIILHDHFEIVQHPDYHLGGLHLNRRNTCIPEGYEGRISRSCHSIQEVKECLGSKVHPLYEYVFLSPLFPSISKEGYGEGFSPEALREAGQKGEIGEKVIALGGISPQTIPLLRDIPFGGVAVLGSLWGKQLGSEKPEEIIKRYNLLQTCLK